MDIIEYHNKNDRIGKSGLDLVNKSPLHYWDSCLNPNKPKRNDTPTTLLGSLYHAAVLEPHRINDMFVVMPEDINRRTKDGKAEYETFLATAGKRKVVTMDMIATAKAMREASLANPIVKHYLSKGIAESTIEFTEPMTGTPGKMRPDWIYNDGEYIIDLKSTSDASEIGFGKSSFKYRYHVQSAWYMDGFFNEFGQRPKGFVFIAQESERPYACSVFVASPEMMELGRAEYLANCATYMQCRTAYGIDGVVKWPAYQMDGKAQYLNLPDYIQRRLNYKP